MGCGYSLPVSVQDEIKECERFYESKKKVTKPIKNIKIKIHKSINETG